MLNNRVRNTWVLVTTLLAFAAFAPTSFAFATPDKPGDALTILADVSSCEASWVAGTSYVPGEIIDQICLATASESRPVGTFQLTQGTSTPLLDDFGKAYVEYVLGPNHPGTVVVTPRASLNEPSSGLGAYWEFVFDQNGQINPEVAPRVLAGPSSSFGEVYWEFVFAQNRPSTAVVTPRVSLNEPSSGLGAYWEFVLDQSR